jgi:predicted RNA-binding Zn-ribbon protein involved in translation (DUF1610 family)
MTERPSDTLQLATLHQARSLRLARKPRKHMLLWYADLNVQVSRRAVEYQCPECGSSLSMPTEEFIERESSSDLRCNPCRGFHEERGGEG